MSTKMKNETEFIFDETLTEGFTVVPNNIFAYEMSDGAIGLYSRILRVKNIPGWKIYQSTLQNKNNGESKIRTAINELIAYGFIKKITLRKKGKIAGVKYMVYSSSQKTDEEIKISLEENNVKKRKNIHVASRKEQRDKEKLNNVGSPENTHVQPKRDFQELENLERENQALINKDTKKIKTLKNKDNTTTKEKATNEKNSSSSSDIDSKNYKITLDIKPVTKMNIKRKKLSVDQLELLEQYVELQDNYDNLDAFACFVAKEIKDGNITKESLAKSKSKKSKVNAPVKQLENFKDENGYYKKAMDDVMQDALNWDDDYIGDIL